MTGLYGILLAVAGILGYVGKLILQRRKALRERDAARLDARVERGRAEVAVEREKLVERVDADQAAARETAREAARDPAVLAATTPAARVDAATDLLRKRETAKKIGRLAKGLPPTRKRGGK